jgi:hypothetical protein
LWYVLGTIFPRCVILSVPRSVFTFFTCHVNSNNPNRHVKTNTTVIRQILTLSAVQQWVAGYLVIF